MYNFCKIKKEKKKKNLSTDMETKAVYNTINTAIDLIR